MTNYDPNDPRNSCQRAISNDGRFNYNRTFNVDTLPKLNGMPLLGNMTIESVGVHPTPKHLLEDIVANTWRQYGVMLTNV